MTRPAFNSGCSIAAAVPQCRHLVLKLTVRFIGNRCVVSLSPYQIFICGKAKWYNCSLKIVKSRVLN